MNVAAAYAECRAHRPRSGSTLLRRDAPAACGPARRDLRRSTRSRGASTTSPTASLERRTKLAALGDIRAQLASTATRADDPVLAAVADAARRYPIPLDAFGDLVDGAEMDVRGHEYATFADTELYGRRVAGSIGRLALGVFETTRPRARRATGRRARRRAPAHEHPARPERGRARSAASTCRRRISTASAATSTDGRIEGPAELLVAFEAQRALGRLEHGLTLVPLLDRRSAACVLAMAGAYRRLLERIALAPATSSSAAGRRCAAGRRAGCSRRASRGARRDRRARRGRRRRPRRDRGRARPRRRTAPTVTLFEARSRLGGATYSVRRKDHWIDNGQHVLLRCCTAYRGFLERLGVEHLVPIQPRLRIPMLREGRPPAFLRRAPLPAPLHLVPTLLRFAPLQPPRAPRTRSARAAALRKLDPADGALDARTFGEWLARAAAVRRRDRGALEPDHAADAQPAGGRGIARARDDGLPHRAARRRRRLRHRRPGGAAATPSRRRGGDGARARGRATSRSARR